MVFIIYLVEYLFDCLVVGVDLWCFGSDVGNCCLNVLFFFLVDIEVGIVEYIINVVVFIKKSFDCISGYVGVGRCLGGFGRWCSSVVCCSGICFICCIVVVVVK